MKKILVYSYRMYLCGVTLATSLLWFAPALSQHTPAKTTSVAVETQKTDAKPTTSEPARYTDKTTNPCCESASAAVSAAATASSTTKKTCCGKTTTVPPPPPPAPTPTPTTALYQKDFPSCVDAKAFVTQFQDVFGAKVKKIEQVGPERVLFLLDTTVQTAKKDDPELDDVIGRIKQVTDLVTANCAENSVDFWIYPKEQQEIPICRTTTDKSVETYCREDEYPSSDILIAAWTKQAIPGVKNIVALPHGRFLFELDKKPDAGDPSPERNLEVVKAQIGYVVRAMNVPTEAVPDPFVVALPPGDANAEKIATALDGKIHSAGVKADGVGRLLVFPAAHDAAPSNRQHLHDEIKRLASSLAEPSDINNVEITGQLTRLFYLRNNISASTTLNNAKLGVNADPVGNDSVMLTASSPGRDSDLLSGQVSRQEQNGEKLSSARRLLAMMDQPHPQISLYAWNLQLSEKEPADPRKRYKADSEDSRLKLVHSVSTLFNQQVGASIDAGWRYLRGEISNNHLDNLFAPYLRGQARIGDTTRLAGGSQVTDALKIQALCCGANAVADGPVYGLGFNRLFSELSPNLMNLLLVVAATNNPYETASCLLDHMEDPKAQLRCDVDVKASVKSPRVGFSRNWQQSADQRKDDPWQADCQQADREGYTPPPRENKLPGMQMECTRALLHSEFAGTDGNPQLGRFRAALADYLFQYKLMVEYPGEFNDYLEPAAAARLDAQLVEFVDAFESDLAVLNYTVRDYVAKVLGSPKGKDQSYDYSGIVGVKVIAGEQADVETSAQNYFPATPPNTLNDYAKAIVSAQAAQASSATATATTAATGGISSAVNDALAVLAQMTPQKQTVSIGRELDLTVSPYSLSAANGAELDIEVTSKDNGAEVVGATPSAGDTKDDDLSSRVSNQHVKSHVRLESLKLFELSSLDSTLARGRAPWKLADPYLEIPVLGELVQKPRHPDLIRLRSVLFLSAVVVPTAADLASTALDEDLYWPNATQREKSLHRFKDISPSLFDQIELYHRRVIECLGQERTDIDGNVTPCTDSPRWER